MIGEKMLTGRSIKSKDTNTTIQGQSYKIAIKKWNKIRNNIKLNEVFVKTDELTISPSGSMVKNLPANAGDVGSIPGLLRSPGEANGNPFQYS